MQKRNMLIPALLLCGSWVSGCRQLDGGGCSTCSSCQSCGKAVHAKNSTSTTTPTAVKNSARPRPNYTPPAVVRESHEPLAIQRGSYSEPGDLPTIVDQSRVPVTFTGNDVPLSQVPAMPIPTHTNPPPVHETLPTHTTPAGVIDLGGTLPPSRPSTPIQTQSFEQPNPNAVQTLESNEPRPFNVTPTNTQSSSVTVSKGTDPGVVSEMTIRYGQEDNYRVLTGRIEQWAREYRLRYAPPDADDAHGGFVVLEGGQTESLKDGNHVRVQGTLVPAEGRRSARYQVNNLEVLAK